MMAASYTVSGFLTFPLTLYIMMQCRVSCLNLGDLGLNVNSALEDCRVTLGQLHTLLLCEEKNGEELFCISIGEKVGE